MNGSRDIKLATNFGSGFVRDAGALIGGTAAAQVAMLAMMPIVTRLFGPDDFGVYTLLMAAVGMLSVLATLRIDTLIPAVKSDPTALVLGQIALLAGICTALATLVVIMLMVFVTPSWNAFGNNVIAAATLPLLIVTFSVYMTVRSLAVRGAQFGLIGRSQVCRALALGLGWITLGCIWRPSPPGLVLAFGQMVADVVFAYLLARALSPWEMKQLRSVAAIRIRAVLRCNSQLIGAIFSSQVLAAIYGRLPIFVIGTVYGVAEAGYYGLADRILAAPGAVTMGIGDVFRQRAAKAYGQGRAFASLLRSIVLGAALIGVPCFLIAIWLTPRFIGVVLGPAWQPAAHTIMVLAAGAMVSFVTSPVDKTPVIVGAHRYIVLWHGARFVVDVALAVLAFAGALAFESYLIAAVVGRCVMYLVDVGVNHQLALRCVGR